MNKQYVRKYPDEITRQELQSLISQGKITFAVLGQVSKVESQWFSDFCENKNNKIRALTNDEVCYISDLSTLLSAGNDISDDERLKGIIEVFLITCKMDLSTLAKCTEIDFDLISNFLQDSKSITPAQKYHLAMRIMFIYYIFKFPDYDKIIFD